MMRYKDLRNTITVTLSLQLEKIYLNVNSKLFQLNALKCANKENYYKTMQSFILQIIVVLKLGANYDSNLVFNSIENLHPVDKRNTAL